LWPFTESVNNWRRLVKILMSDVIPQIAGFF